MQDVSAVQVGEAIQVRFSPPQVNTDGSPAGNLGKVELYRCVGDWSAPWIAAAEFPARAELLKVWRDEELQAPLQQGFFFHADEPPQRYRARFSYGVRVQNRKGQDAGLSNLAQIAPVPIPVPPSGLTAQVQQEYIEVRWSVPSSNRDGSVPPRVEGFLVYRSERGDEFPDVPLSDSLLSSPWFRDTAFQFGHRYFYRVVLVARQNPLVRTEASESLQVDPKDVFAPKAPSGLTAVTDGTTAILTWTENSEPDLSGYRLYRSEGSGAGHRTVQQGLLVRPYYRDEAVEGGKTYFYVVTAVDQAGNESAPAQEVPVPF
ncbi:MAG: hypothetical protein HY652_07820 [Acidobacteria bacterium]|nr:hypothetical protein [Acidobacteriota bacterium]